MLKEINMKNKSAQSLAALSWKKRKKDPKTKENLSKAGKLGAAKTNEIKRLKRLALDKSVIHNSNTSNA